MIMMMMNINSLYYTLNLFRRFIYYIYTFIKYLYSFLLLFLPFDFINVLQLNSYNCFSNLITYSYIILPFILLYCTHIIFNYYYNFFSVFLTIVIIYYQSIQFFLFLYCSGIMNIEWHKFFSVFILIIITPYYIISLFIFYIYPYYIQLLLQLFFCISTILINYYQL